MPAVGVRVLAAFLLGACLLGCTSRGPCHLVGDLPDGGTTVGFDLTQVLANVPGPVVVWACLDLRCVRHIGSSSSTFDVHIAASDGPQVDVRVVVGEHGRVVFDTTRQL